MTNIEQKAEELVTRYGHDMARVRARHLAERGSGVIRRWWEGVARAISVAEAAQRAA